MLYRCSRFTLCCIFIFTSTEKISGNKNTNEYSFSLSTLSPEGRLHQVEYASRASSLGPTVIAAFPSFLQKNNTNAVALLLAPDSAESLNPLIAYDGTSRYVRLTQNIVLTHLGIGADGSVLIAALQKAAIQHQYIYDEEISVNAVLEELSNLMQLSTMKP